MSEQLVSPKPHFLRLPMMRPSTGRRLGSMEVAIIDPKMSSAKRAGLRYEKKAKKHLLELVDDAHSDVWWQYFEGRSPIPRRCQTDVVAFNEDFRLITVFEIKSQHTSDSWWQLRHLYEPVLLAVYGLNWRVNVVEVCRIFDPAVKFPEPIFDIKNEVLNAWTKTPHPEFGVHRWRP